MRGKICHQLISLNCQKKEKIKAATLREISGSGYVLFGVGFYKMNRSCKIDSRHSTCLF